MNIKKTIAVLYNSLLFIVPLILWPYTSELFEFNKIVVTYIFTVLVLFFWILRCIFEKKIIFKRTVLDIPILIFIGSQTISTIISIDARTSVFGYYSRFNGGLLSIIGYSILYWGYVSNLQANDVLSSIKMILFSTFLSSVYGILERFGIDKDIWVQDVQNRVFSTFGQPNWLAAWLAAVIPVSISWGFTILRQTIIGYQQNSKLIDKSIKYSTLIKTFIPYIISSIFFITLLFTKSRSGILGFGIANLVYWGLVLIFLLKLIGKINDKTAIVDDAPQATSPALELGGSSSVEIRKIVWQGAIDVWKNYPLFGSGVETFAFSYYRFRPVSHNLVSEWDFLYNKAHNEYLNFMATTGSVGILTYTILIICSLYIFSTHIFKLLKDQNLKIDNTIFKNDDLLITIGLFSGFISILITNFFGFSVVPVNLLFFLFPAMAVAMVAGDRLQVTSNKPQATGKSDELNVRSYKILKQEQKVFSFFLLLVTCYLLFSISRYWYADILYNKADGLAKSGNLIDSVKTINSAIEISPKEAVYHDELASQLADIALVYKSQNNEESAKLFSQNAVRSVTKAETLSPNNLNILRNKARVAILLSEVNPIYILDAKNALLKGIEMAPTEAKLYHNLSLTYYRIGDVEKPTETLKITIDLKANYKDARYAYAIIMQEKGNIEEAKYQLEYILKNIDPNDTRAKVALEEIDGLQNSLD
ncbi:MAG: hypothetical protein US95_C0009G0023 [Candidatus Woesebacteria bacterium GW2011_GWB1_38_5]|uniref:O-antigen ligase-related domain-containing protein n=1 Tax=Candidatus Woesebacteria bacterium GW2011_GWB1_38_5 TaxID=1618568 RepID=A0A0G0K647_9BACT|nr:MAG: hypothetical protein US95_C0009G0023 [Candidatus Woesebacteria bacterium GW2011_GWB1_38_5]